MDTLMELDLDMLVWDILVLDMLVLDMLVSAMLDLDMEVFTPPTLPSAMLLPILLMELPTPPTLECAPTILELRFLARHMFARLKFYQSTWD